MLFSSFVKPPENSTKQRISKTRHARARCHNIFGKTVQTLGLRQKKVKKIVKKSEKGAEKSLHFLKISFIMCLLSVYGMKR